jgi:hypothetical protein
MLIQFRVQDLATDDADSSGQQKVVHIMTFLSADFNWVQIKMYQRVANATKVK